jgi:hypothetical protein
MGLGDLTFFTSCRGFGNRGGLGAAGGLNALGCGSARCLFGLAQSTAHGGVGFFGLMGTCSLRSMTSGRLCGGCGGFGFGLGQQRLLTDLFGGTVSQLRAILAARRGEVAIFCSVKIRPGVKDGYIFRGFSYRLIVRLVRAARIHFSCSCRADYRWFYLNCAGSLPVQKDAIAPVIMQ